jgi:GntR family transcriptional repressor for pyruvate dehydrogenase complex
MPSFWTARGLPLPHAAVACGKERPPVERKSVARNSARNAIGSAVGPRRTEKISEVLAREIVRDLRDLPPSTMLPPESIMLDKYRVGRASLREALRLLEVQGLIIIRPGPGGGPMVAQVDSTHYGRMASLYYHMSGATYQDVVDARLVMEPVVARIVAERQDPEHLKTLTEYLDRMTTSDPDHYWEDATGFHAMLLNMSGNPVLNLSARSLQDVFLDRVQGMLFPLEEQRRVEQEHATIARAIVKGDAARAERLMRKHMIEYVHYSQQRHPGVLDETVDWH